MYTKIKVLQNIKRRSRKMFKQAASRLGVIRRGVAPLPLEEDRGSPGKKIRDPVK